MMEPAGDTASVLSVVLAVGKCFADPIGRHFMYLYKYRNNLDNLEIEVGELKAAEEEVKDKVVAAKKNVEKINYRVKEWQKNVDSIIVQADNLIAEKENDRCFNGFCPNLITRYKHGKKAFKIKDNISPFLQQQKAFDKVSNPTILEDARLQHDQNYTEMASRNSILRDIVNALNDAKVNVIGIYGAAGIGKTTIVKEVAKQVKKFFDEMVFVEVTETPDVKKIQTEIADQLHLQFKNETEKINKLYERLKKKEEKDGEKNEKENEGKILIILDNIWGDNFDLKSIGIPDQSDDRGCKLLLTARGQRVLKNMGDPKPLQIGNLSEEESWRLFQKMAGDFIETHEFKPLAENICSRCKGLPIAIVTIAKALKYKTHPSQWKEALRKLRRSSPKNFTGEIKEAYATIELSYKYLQGEELQKTFLLCSLMTHRGFILDLVKYVVGLDIFQDIYTIEEARDKVYDLISELKDLCLLFNSHTNESFSMHDFVREVALSIANRDDHVFSVRNENTWQWPHQDRLKICKKIFIRDSTNSELCNGLDCPELESFFMNTKIDDSHFEIPENFFAKMTKLKVLDLTRMQFFSLQSSLQFLVNLQTLCLDYCKLEDVAIIGVLNELKILSLRGSNVEHLPKEIGQLTELRLLDLSDCQELNFMAPNVLSSLVKLEELYMNGCSVVWEVEASNVERSNASLGELKYLSHLTTLELHIKDEKMIPKGLFTAKKLERYKISIGDHMQYMHIKSSSFDEHWTSTRMLKLKLTSIIWSEELQVFRNVEFLCIDELKQGIENVLYELDKEGFSKLKHLHVHNNPNILYLVDSIKCVPHDAFPAFPLLESLILFNLIELQKICYGQPIVGSFCNLKIIEVRGCTKLENIFSFSNPRSLPQLQRIDVSDCKNMKQIFIVERGDDASINKKLEVKTPSTSQSSHESTTDLQCSDINLEHELDTPSPLFNEKVIFPNLEAVELLDLNSKMIWDNKLPTMSSCYLSLTRLIIMNLGKLKYVFPSFIVKNFEQLQHLEISNCEELNEIIAKEEGVEAAATFMFPQMESLNLSNLPELTTFYSGIHTSTWLVLKKLVVSNCHKLHIFTSEYKVVFPNLEDVRLQAINSQMIWDSQLPPMSDCYQNLTRLIIKDVRKLKYVFPSSMVKNFKQLQHLEIRSCKELKEIVAKEGAEPPSTFIFPRVDFLKLGNLPELTTFYPGIHTSEWPKLKDLVVYNCHKLHISTSEYKVVFPNLEDARLQIFNSQMIWDSQLPPMSDCYRNLTRLIIEDIGKLKYVFPSSMVKNFKQLQHLEIRSCKELKEIVAKEGVEAPPTFIFPRVEYLKLGNLPELTTFYPGIHTSEWPKLKDLVVSDCHKLYIFTSEYKVVFPSLEDIRLQAINTQMIWDSQLPPISDGYRNLICLIIEDIRKLKYVFPSSMVKNFKQLQHLEIRSCKELKEIVAKEGAEAPLTFIFPRVEFLKLGNLPELTTFYPGIHTSKWPKLKKLVVYNCHKLHISTSEYKVVFPNLEGVRLQAINSQMIWDSQLPPMSDCYQNLTRLIIEDIGKVKYVFSSSMVKNFKQLQHLEIRSCKELEEIVAKEGTEAPPTFIFPQVEYLKLGNLPELTTFYPGIHTSAWPKLKDLVVSNCHKLHISTSEYKVVFPNLEDVRLQAINSQMIWDSQLPPKSNCYQNLTRLIIEDIRKVKYVFPFYMVKNFKQLQHLEIRSCKELKEIVAKGAKTPPTFIFPQVEFLKLGNLPELTTFYLGKHTSEWPKLKELVVFNCHKLHIFTSEYKVVFPNLEDVRLQAINSQMIWDSQLPPMSYCYRNLARLIIKDIGKLKYVFPSYMVKNFGQLQHLEIRSCKELKEIVAKGAEVHPTFIFPQVEFLKLVNLPELTTFYRGIHTSKWPKLMKLVVYNCHKLHIFTSEYKVVFPNLEDGRLQAINSQMIWDRQLPPMSYCYRNLARLIIKDIGKLKYVFPSYMVKNFEQLQHLEISYCKELKEIVSKEGAEEPLTFIFPQLEFLELANLPEFTTFYPRIHTSKWPKLMELEVYNCDKLQMSTSQCKIVFPNLEVLDLHGTHIEMIWDHLIRKTSSYYQNLTRLIMAKCAKLKYVFPSSMIKSFERLQHLEISSCTEVKEIVIKEEGAEAIATFTFPQVAFLKLDDLPELTGLCLGLHTSEWPMLKELEVFKCDKLQLTSNFQFKPVWEESLLRVDNMMTWQCLFPEHFFFKGTIEIKGDKSINILLDILQRSIHIEKLLLSESLYKEIFSCGEKDKRIETLMQLKSLKLRNLSKLKCMWKQDSKLDFVLQNLGVLEIYDCHKLISLLPSHASFANLTVLRVDSCWGLINLFLPSTAKSLVRLMEMKIENCKMITEIISNEDNEDLRVEDEIVFSKLKLLSLEDLESLTCFCFGNYNFEFPILEELIVKECPNMKTFTEAVVSAPSLGKVKFEQDDNEEGCWKGDLNTTIQHLHKKEVNSNLEKLTLSGKDIMPVWQDPLPEHQFCQVKVLDVIKVESAQIPIEILQRFKNLEKLILKLSSYQEIFSCREDEKYEKYVGMLTQIKELELWGLFDLKYTWKQDSHVNSILQNVELLQVCYCHNLINLLPSPSFENLKTLAVVNCDGLVNLVSSSTAKSLVRLEEMIIRGCEMMIEVVSNEGDKKDDEIVFEKLKSLTLGELESLASFCSGNYTFKFPTLEELVAEECPKMKTFSEGVLSTPSLQKVMQRWNDREGHWEGDLNTTIQHRHKNLNIQISEKDPGQTSVKSPE